MVDNQLPPDGVPMGSDYLENSPSPYETPNPTVALWELGVARWLDSLGYSGKEIGEALVRIKAEMLRSDLR